MISGALGKNSIVVGIGMVSPCVTSFEIRLLLSANDFINMNAEALAVIIIWFLKL